METVKDVFKAYKSGLASIYVSNEIEAITLLILTTLLNTSKAKIKAFPDKRITEVHQMQLLEVLSELKTGKPVQYVIGHTDFYGLSFKVNQSVLIPRPETEELVEWILTTVKDNTQAAILDIGTGSGCIPIALEKNLIGAEIYAIDISADALAIAKENSILNEANINFIQADILSQPEIGALKFDVIVSNPPYVTPTDKEKMHQNVTNFEPHLALFVPQEDPLLFYNAITAFALKHLNHNGYLFFEINESYGEVTVELLKYKEFINIELRKDMSGRDRMVKAQLPI